MGTSSSGSSLGSIAASPMRESRARYVGEMLGHELWPCGRPWGSRGTLASTTSLTNPVLLAQRSSSGYYRRGQSWKPSHAGTTPHDHYGNGLPLLLRSTNEGFAPPATALAEPWSEATNQTPWTPRLTHLRRPRTDERQRGAPQPFAPLGGQRPVQRASASWPLSPASHETLPPWDDGLGAAPVREPAPVRPFSSHYDRNPRGKFR